MDWTTAASLATAGGTLILALATFASTRSANRAARASERALLVGLRPVLMAARVDDPPEKVRFVDDQWLRIAAGMGSTAVVEDRVYLAMPLRNVAAGLAVLHGWHLRPQQLTLDTPLPPAQDFRVLSRDLYVPAGGTGFWQGAVRESDDPLLVPLREAVAEGNPISLDLLYGDHEGGQRTITRFLWTFRSRDENPDGGAMAQWRCSAVRHHSLDGHNPR